MLKTNHILVAGGYPRAGSSLLKNIIINYKKITEGFCYFFVEDFCYAKKSLENNSPLLIKRHPYEIIMSGVRYHELGLEPWLHVKKKELNNKSYFDILKNKKTIEEKILFEIEYISSKKINKICFDIKNINNNFWIKIEDLYSKNSQEEIADGIILKYNLKKYFKECVVESCKTKINKTKDNLDYTWCDIFDKEIYNSIEKFCVKDCVSIMGY
jgi:uncharacterized protein YabN with tetrapyrrole methylase and pyrophosphatase domain